MAAKWSSTLVGSYAASKTLSGSVTNRLPVDATISVDVRAAGLGGHFVSRRVFDGVVAANFRVPLTISVGDIPLQAPEEAIQAELVVLVTDPPEYAGLTVPSRPLYVRATSASFANFQLYGETPPTGAILSSPATFEQAVAQIQGAVDSVRYPAYGRYFDSTTAEWRSLATLAQPGDDYHLQDRQVKLTTADSELIGGLFGPNVGPVDSSYAPTYVCAQWPAEFIDEAKGEEKGFPYAASYAEAFISEADHLPLWSGTLDAAGCSPALTLKNYTGYSLGLRTRFHRGVFGSGTTVSVLDKNGAPETTAAGWYTLNVLRPEPAEPIHITLKMQSWGNDETRVSATVSASLRALGQQLPDGEYTVRANERCSNTSTACFKASNDTLYIGANYDSPQTHNSQYKFVVAHEFGHAVQFKGSGLMRADYANSPSKNDNGACGCAFVSDPNDRSHCLQSKESLGIASAEGFAHYFASRVWNYDDPASCTFVYYKNFNEGGVIRQPPLARSCASEVRWLANNCSQAQRGVEWDWMNFQRALAVSPAPTALADLLEIYKAACGGTSCSGVERDFQDLALAASTKYGAADSRATTFQNLGVSYGVDY